MINIFNLNPGERFEFKGDEYVCGRYADERSTRVTRLKDGRASTIMFGTKVEVIENAVRI